MIDLVKKVRVSFIRSQVKTTAFRVTWVDPAATCEDGWGLVPLGINTVVEMSPGDLVVTSEHFRGTQPGSHMFAIEIVLPFGLVEEIQREREMWWHERLANLAHELLRMSPAERVVRACEHFILESKMRQLDDDTDDVAAIPDDSIDDPEIQAGIDMRRRWIADLAAHRRNPQPKCGPTEAGTQRSGTKSSGGASD